MNITEFNDLPDNIVIQVFLHFRPKELLSFSRVCKRWQDLIGDRWLWKHVKFSPYSITKVKLSFVIRHYFSKYTKSIDVCGKLKGSQSSYAISNKVLELLKEKSPSLTAFRLEDEYLINVDLSLLFTSLQHLCFASCEIDLSCLKQCASKFIHLRSLVFKRCPCVTEKHLQSFGTLDKLERLELKGTYRLDDDVAEIICNNFQNLTSLSMIGCAHCGDKSCAVIAEKLVKLKFLEIEEWTKLSQRGVDMLSNDVKTLKFLSVNCRQINGGYIIIQGSRVLL